MKYYLVFLMLFLLNPVYSAEPQDLYKQALSDYKTGFYNKAARVEISKKYLIKAKTSFENIIQQYPDTLEAQLSSFKIGYCYYKLEDYLNAINCFQEYIAKYPDDKQYYIDDVKHQLGLAYKLSKDYVKAEKSFKSVFEYKTETNAKLKNIIPQSYFELWRLYLKTKNTIDASKIYTEFLTSYPDHPLAQYMVNMNKYQ
jgi:outer membrane protein assembly factor BamD (BamD/ComL family)